MRDLKAKAVFLLMRNLLLTDTCNLLMALSMSERIWRATKLRGCRLLAATKSLSILSSFNSMGKSPYA